MAWADQKDIDSALEETDKADPEPDQGSCRLCDNVMNFFKALSEIGTQHYTRGESFAVIEETRIDGSSIIVTRLPPQSTSPSATSEASDPLPTTAPTSASPASSHTGAERRLAAMHFFVADGYSKEQAAGIVGNLMQESGSSLNPDVRQKGFSGEGYGAYDDGAGYGLAQWTYPDRKKRLKTWSEENNLDYKNFDTQLQFIKHELDVTPYYGKKELKKQASLEGATQTFMLRYENPGHPALEQRTDFARQALAEFEAANAV